MMFLLGESLKAASSKSCLNGAVAKVHSAPTHSSFSELLCGFPAADLALCNPYPALREAIMQSDDKDRENGCHDQPSYFTQLENLRKIGVVLTADSIIASAGVAASSDRATEIDVSTAVKGRFVAAASLQFATPSDIEEGLAELKSMLGRTGSRKSEDGRDKAIDLWCLIEPSLSVEEQREIWPALLRHLGDSGKPISASRGNHHQGGGR